jgi:hypothetical protein
LVFVRLPHISYNNNFDQIVSLIFHESASKNQQQKMRKYEIKRSRQGDGEKCCSTANNI